MLPLPSWEGGVSAANLPLRNARVHIQNALESRDSRFGQKSDNTWATTRDCPYEKHPMGDCGVYLEAIRVYQLRSSFVRS
jgi:hypothetical protein